MTKKPFINAILAGAYIVAVVLVINYFVEGQQGVDTLFTPMAMIALFVLSAAVMGYLFAYEPLQLYLDGKKKEAVAFFFQTVGIFAIITAVFFSLLVSS